MSYIHLPVPEVDANGVIFQAESSPKKLQDVNQLRRPIDSTAFPAGFS